MSALTGLMIVAATFATSFLSGIFGMAGGLILMGVLLALVSVPAAMVLHGAIQTFANGYRAWLLREHIQWRVFGLYSLGAIFGIALLFLVSWVPDKQIIYLILGLVPLLIWLPRDWAALNIQRRGQAIFAGFLVQGFNTLAGVAGPLLDLFFVRSDLTRQEIVATKSITQTLSHLIKIGFWIVPLLALSKVSLTEGAIMEEPLIEGQILPLLWVIGLALPASLLGTRFGAYILHRMGEVNFRRWMKGLITAIGAVFLMRAFGLF